jgi:hypothetical protein
MCWLTRHLNGNFSCSRVRLRALALSSIAGTSLGLGIALEGIGSFFQNGIMSTGIIIDRCTDA